MNYSYDNTLSDLQYYHIPEEPITITSSQGDTEVFDFPEDNAVVITCFDEYPVDVLDSVTIPGKHKKKDKRRRVW